MNTKNPLLLRTAATLVAVTMAAALSAQQEPAAQPGSTSNDPGATTPISPSARADAVVTNSNLARSDKNFFEKAAKSGLKEVEISQAVMAKLTTPGAREFAQMMVTEHSKANEELRALAARKGVALPVERDRSIDKWTNKTKDVDNDYLEQMKDDHEDAVDLFEKAAKSEDADIAAFAQKTLPTLQHHLQLLKSDPLKSAR